MAEFGISMDGRAPVTDIPAQAKAAEEGGASTLWIACHLYLRDPITMAALALGATRRIKIALMAMSPYSVHPVFIAMAAATLDEMYPGRVILCLGAGAPADLKAAGLEATKPLVSIDETVKICRALLAASRARMLKLAGRASDGVLISAATSPPFVKACLAEAASANPGFRKVGIVYTKLGATEKEGIDPIRRPIGFVLRGAHHAENIRLDRKSVV